MTPVRYSKSHPDRCEHGANNILLRTTISVVHFPSSPRINSSHQVTDRMLELLRRGHCLRRPGYCRRAPSPVRALDTSTNSSLTSVPLPLFPSEDIFTVKQYQMLPSRTMARRKPLRLHLHLQGWHFQIRPRSPDQNWCVFRSQPHVYNCSGIQHIRFRKKVRHGVRCCQGYVLFHQVVRADALTSTVISVAQRIETPLCTSFRVSLRQNRGRNISNRSHSLHCFPLQPSVSPSVFAAFMSAESLCGCAVS